MPKLSQNIKGYDPRSGIQNPVSSFQIQSRGFTLLEILIAIFIFAVVAATIFGSFNAVFGNSSTVKEGMGAFEMARDCLSRMMVDLHSLHVSQLPAYAPPDSEESQDPYRLVGGMTFSGDTGFGRMRFASLAHLPLGKDKRAGIAEIVYYVEPSKDGTFVLRRSDRLEPFPPPEEKGGDPILCENVKSLTFTFIDDEGEEQDRWDSESEDFAFATPRAIRISLVLGTDDFPHPFEATVALMQYRNGVEIEK